MLIDIKNSEAKSHNNGMPPSYAHDGNYGTFYSVQNFDTAGNYLKLYLDGLYTISTVNVTNRLDGHHGRFGNTKVMVITTDATRFGAGRVTDCGTVTGKYYSVYLKLIFGLIDVFLYFINGLVLRWRMLTD